MEDRTEKEVLVGEGLHLGLPVQPVVLSTEKLLQNWSAAATTLSQQLKKESYEWERYAHFSFTIMKLNTSLTPVSITEDKPQLPKVGNSVVRCSYVFLCAYCCWCCSWISMAFSSHISQQINYSIVRVAGGCSLSNYLVRMQ